MLTSKKETKIDHIQLYMLPDTHASIHGLPLLKALKATELDNMGLQMLHPFLITYILLKMDVLKRKKENSDNFAICYIPFNPIFRLVIIRNGSTKL